MLCMSPQQDKTELDACMIMYQQEFFYFFFDVQGRGSVNSECLFYMSVRIESISAVIIFLVTDNLIELHPLFI